MSSPSKQTIIVKSITCISLNIALLTVCAWISVPFAVSFTLQTFALFAISAIFRPKIALTSLFAYLAIGILGIPVFAGFQGGAIVLLGPSGGYLLGFIPCVAVVSIASYKSHNKTYVMILSMLSGLFLCYIFGTVWYVNVYAPFTFGSFWAILMCCVIPFLIPDIIKLFLAVFIVKRLLPYKQRYLDA